METSIEVKKNLDGNNTAIVNVDKNTEQNIPRNLTEKTYRLRT
jgi:hypothetical protein